MTAEVFCSKTSFSEETKTCPPLHKRFQEQSEVQFHPSLSRDTSRLHSFELWSTGEGCRQKQEVCPAWTVLPSNSRMGDPTH